MSARDSRGSLDSLRRLSDEELARTAAGGDEGAARVLLERFEEPLYRYTLALVRDPDLAREATWSALFEAARAVRMDDYSEPVQPWLFRVAHTAADVAGGRPNGAIENDEAAALAAAAGGEDRERLEGLLAGLDELPARDRGSLLLRELVGLEYTGIATVTATRASAARQSVFRARLALQGNPDPPTEHCDEIRAAMSKAEEGVRERWSIASHLEECPVCEEFARQLEIRPDDLRTLFPAPEEPLAAELVPPLPPVPGRTEAAAAGAAAISPGDERPDRGRRRGLIAVALAVVLVAAGIATALALNDNGGGDKGKARAAREGSVTLTAPDTTKTEKPAKPKEPKTSKEPSKPKAAGGGSAAAGGGSKAESGESPEKAGSAERGGSADGEAAKGGAAASGGSGSEQGGSEQGGSATKSGEAASGGRSATKSGEASATEGGSAGTSPGAAESSASAAQAAADGQTVPRTGLDVSLVVVMGLLMLALGISLRRVYAEL